MKFWRIIMEALLGTVADDMAAMTRPPVPTSDGFIIIPPTVLDSLSDEEREFLKRVVRQSRRSVARDYPGKRFQIILRNVADGQFKTLPRAKALQGELIKDDTERR